MKEQLKELDGEIARRAKADPVARRLMTIPGIGRIAATAITALVPCLAGQGYAVSAFAVDWEAKTVTCPQGHRSVNWVVNHDPWGTGTVHVGFAKATCRACPSRPRAPAPKRRRAR